MGSALGWLALLSIAAGHGPSAAKLIAKAAELRAHHAYDKALAELEKAEKVTDNPTQDVAVALDEGIVLVDLKRKKEAGAKFRKALALDPEAKLTWSVSPKLAKAFERVRAEFKPDAPTPAPAPSAPVAALADAPAIVTPPKPPPPAPVAVAVEEPAASVRAEAPAPRHRRGWALIPAAAGVAAAGVGGVLAFQAKANDDILAGRSGPASLTLDQAQGYRSRGQLEQNVSIALIAAGSAAAIAGAVLYLLPVREDRPTVTAVLQPSGISLAGVFR